MRNDPLLTQIGLDELNNRGYINLHDASIDLSFRNCSDDEIHPLFQRGRWSQKDLATMDFDALRPTLRLASRLLQCNTSIYYLSAILDQANYGTIDPKYLRPESNPNWFRVPDNLSTEKKLATRAALDDLVTRTTWQLLDSKVYPDIAGMTRLHWVPVDPPIVGMPQIRTTKLYLASIFIDILCRGVSPASFAVEWTPGTDAESARLRYSLVCAIALVHEVMHAFWNVRGEYPEEGILTEGPPEPFYMDTRIAELGFQWQTLVLGGEFYGILEPFIFPYGARTSRWPGPTELAERKHTELRMSLRKYGHVRNWQTRYAVSMDWVRSLFTDAFWKEIERSGDAGLKIQRKLGARRKLDDEFQWLEDEEQVPYEFIVSPTSVLSNEDEEDCQGLGIVDRYDMGQKWHMTKNDWKRHGSEEDPPASSLISDFDHGIEELE